jgi:hypothetical protein
MNKRKEANHHACRSSNPSGEGTDEVVMSDAEMSPLSSLDAE